MSRKFDLRHFAEHLSRARITPYLCGTSCPEEAMRQYEENVWNSLRFMLVIHFLEVALRNEMDKVLCALYGPHWFERPNALIGKQVKQYAQARHQLLKQRKKLAHDNFIAELPLGFWVGLLAKRYERHQQYWRRALHRCFSHRPKGIDRREIHEILERLRRFRNKVAHHERILHHSPDKHIRKALEVLGWIDPNLENWAQDMLDRMP